MEQAVVMKTPHGLRTTAIHNNQILLVCCTVLKQYVSAHTQKAIIRLKEYERKIIM